MDTINDILLEVKTHLAIYLKTVFNTLKNILDTVNIEFKIDDGYMRIHAMDFTKSILINMKLNKENFDTFYCNKNELLVGIDVNKFYERIQSIGDNDTLTLKITNNNQHNLNIQIDGSNKGSLITSIPILELGKNVADMPHITFDAIVTVDSKKFNKICREMKENGAYVEIKYTPNKIEFTSRDTSFNKKTAYKMFGGGNDSKLSINVNKNVPETKQTIMLKELVLFSHFKSLCSSVEIFMKNDFPIVLKYNVGPLGRILICFVPVTPAHVN